MSQDANGASAHQLPSGGHMGTTSKRERDMIVKLVVAAMRQNDQEFGVLKTFARRAAKKDPRLDADELERRARLRGKRTSMR